MSSNDGTGKGRYGLSQETLWPSLEETEERLQENGKVTSQSKGVTTAPI
jgi:hypothetical protein